MFQEVYEKMVQFASEEDLATELTDARQEFEKRTGEMFESDANYERRLAAFLEWYVLDRPVSTGTHQTPAKLFIDSVSPDLTTPEVQRLRDLTRTTLSLFAFKRSKGDHLQVIDLLRNTKHEIYERRKPAGLEPRDILEARLIPFDEKLFFSEVFAVHPRETRKVITKAAKKFQKEGKGEGDIDLVHRVAYLANRCERYQHVDPVKIFEDL